MARISVDERLSAHALRVGFITEANDKAVRDEEIMRHTRHCDLRTMRGYVQHAGTATPPLSPDPAARTATGCGQPLCITLMERICQNADDHSHIREGIGMQSDPC
jgi:hypothetical protein